MPEKKKKLLVLISVDWKANVKKVTLLFCRGVTHRPSLERGREKEVEREEMREQEREGERGGNRERETERERARERERGRNRGN